MFKKVVEIMLRDGSIKYAVRKGQLFYKYQNLYALDMWHRKSEPYFLSSCLTANLKEIKVALEYTAIPAYREKELNMSKLEQLIKGLK